MYPAVAICQSPLAFVRSAARTVDPEAEVADRRSQRQRSRRTRRLDARQMTHSIDKRE